MKDPLALEARRRIVGTVSEFPGLHLRELARTLGMDANHVKYHVRALERHGLVSSREADGYVRFFPRAEGQLGMQETLGRDDKRLLSVLRRPVPLHIAVLLLDGPLHHSAIKEAVGFADSTLHYHLKKMEKAGIVIAERQGRMVFYRLPHADHIQTLLLRHRPPDALVAGFMDAWDRLSLD